MPHLPIRTRALQLCVLALVFGLALPLAGCAYYQARARCGAAGCAGDAQITQDVQALFGQHTEFGNQLHVTTTDHVVYLTGQVATDLQRDSAASLARSVAGVRKVVNNVSVSYGGR
jgi:osmotically-inducible protein OsmY